LFLMKSQRDGARWPVFGAWVREHRLRLKKTQKEIAKEAGITDVQLSRIENGESGTRHETILALAGALHADVGECYRMAGFTAPGGDAVPIDEELAQIVKSIPESMRPRFLRAVRTMAEMLTVA
jgi:transcriptional regulator with XRE-family HTH domain